MPSHFIKVYNIGTMSGQTPAYIRVSLEYLSSKVRADEEMPGMAHRITGFFVFLITSTLSFFVGRYLFRDRPGQ
jgi:hypothetical protein